MTENEPALKDVLASVKSVGEDLSPLRTWLAEVDVAAVATPAVIKTFSGMAGEQLSADRDARTAGGARWSGGAAILPALKIYQQAVDVRRRRIATGGDRNPQRMRRARCA